MAELTKLRPDRDLQCFYEQPSAIAALSEVSETGFTLSGTWRQQFDWALVEWNRDNTIEHPALRNLPDGNLSGLTLSYEEVRTNCAAIDSKTFDAVGWSVLRIWQDAGGVETFHRVPLKNHATPIEGSYVQATATFELQGTATAGDYIELAWLDQHANAIVGTSLEEAVEDLAGFINALQPAGGVSAFASGTSITLVYTGALGANGNRIGVYGGVYGAETESWSPAWQMFSGGESPTQWRIELNFSNLVDDALQTVNMTSVRKMRWTWAAELQWAPFARTEFSVVVNDWQVGGGNRDYYVPGPGSRRIEDDAAELAYTGSWSEGRGNFSGGSIRWTTAPGAFVSCAYLATSGHTLLLGTRRTNSGGQVSVVVDGGPPIVVGLNIPAEDVLVRVPLGMRSAGQHTVTVTHTGAPGSDFYFDFLEIAIPTTTLPTFSIVPDTTLATDWDTYHSLAIAPERTAWLVDTMGFRGRANHYVGALWFYELVRPGNVYASATITFSGTPEFGGNTEVVVAGTTIAKPNYITDTAESIAKAFELLITAGSSAVWAETNGAVLTIHGRGMGAQGNAITIAAGTFSAVFTATVSGATLAGGADGPWLTDLTASPRLNRAARDWHRSYYQAMAAYGIPVTAAFSMELKDGDTSLAAGIAQRYPSGPVLLNTPAVQTNFGPQSTAFWKQAYRDMADVMDEAGMLVYLQFGEVQWWYFADASGMPFYDSYTTGAFQAAYGRPMALITNQNVDPELHPEEAAFLPTLIGQFTDTVMSHVRQAHPVAQFEVLYPPDTNDSPFSRVMNYPTGQWTPANLACLKTENFTYTGNRDLNKARYSLGIPAQRGFAPSQSSHLVGIGEYTTPWLREHGLALGDGKESVVLFALDQFCLIGYGLPLKRGPRRAIFMAG